MKGISGARILGLITLIFDGAFLIVLFLCGGLTPLFVRRLRPRKD